ncbi:MAG: hypothetical protein JMJ93_03960 [Synergistaceae bacterium]|jgi:hypothetical protein|nr:hypothetical protein [Synergistaceae bacterium]
MIVSFAKRLLILSLLAFAALFLAAPLFAGAQDFVIVNRTGADIYGLYISPSTSDSWEENMIEGSVLPDGNELEINFSGYDSSEAHWDIMVTDENDDSLTWEDINLLKYGRITLHFDGSRIWADLE